LSVYTILLLPRSTLFPYTTLFRSIRFAAPVLGDLIDELLPVAGGSTRIDDYQRRARGREHLIVPTRVPLVEPGALRATVDKKDRSEEHTSELQSLAYLVCRLLLEK